MELAEASYEVTREFPASERYGLASQIQRSAVSIPSNIAEGSGRNSSGDFIRFLRIAYGSSCELETQALIAGRIDLGDTHALRHIVVESEGIRRMLFALIERMNAER